MYFALQHVCVQPVCVMNARTLVGTDAQGMRGTATNRCSSAIAGGFCIQASLCGMMGEVCDTWHLIICWLEFVGCTVDVDDIPHLATA